MQVFIKLASDPRCFWSDGEKSMWNDCFIHVFRSAYLFILLVVLGGCTFFPRDTSVSKGFTFPDSDGDGIVFFTASNPTNNGTFLNLYIQHENKAIDSDRLHNIHPLEIVKMKTADFFGYPLYLPSRATESNYVIAVRLPPGKYRILNWRIWDYYRPVVSSVGNRQMYKFTVTKDRASYAGHLRFEVAENSSFAALLISDQFTRDGQWFMTAYPAIQNADILNELIK